MKLQFRVTDEKSVLSGGRIIKPLKMLSLFSGIGGIDLAGEWAGIKTVGFCEIDPFCQKVLKKHWPDVPIYSDIKDLRGDEFGTVDIIAGGFPCQPFSVAGEQRGKEDERYLWKEMLRIIETIRPTWVIGENVVGIVKLALDDVLLDLETKGYTTQTFIIPACAVNAPHRRERVFIVAHSECSGLQVDSKKLRNYRFETSAALEHDCFKGVVQSDNRLWPSESEFRRVANGFPNWMDRFKSIGNAVVPHQIAPIFKAIVAIEENKIDGYIPSIREM